MATKNSYDTIMRTDEYFDATSSPAAMIRIQKVWPVNEFIQLKESLNEAFITSKPFSSDLWPECVWELRLYPMCAGEDCTYADCDGDDEHIRWDLIQVGTPEINAKVKAYCLKNDNSEDSVHAYSDIFESGRAKVVGGKHWADPEPALRDGGELVIVCELEYFHPIKLCSHEVSAVGQFMLISQIAQTPKRIVPIAPSTLLQSLYTEQKFCDASIEVGNRTLFVHRGILAMHSTVFSCMFATGLQESREHILKITDSQFEPVRAMIEYFYMPEKLNEQDGGNQSSSNTNADQTTSSSDAFSLTNAIHEFTEDVLALAEKYDVMPLKDFCERVLVRRLDEKNLCDMFVFADTFHCDNLTQSCLHLFRASHHTVRKSAKWTQLKLEHGTLADRLYDGLLDLMT